MADDARCVLQTCYGTVLCHLPAGELFHARPESALANLLFQADGRPLGDIPFKVTPLGAGRGFSVGNANGFLSAQPGGRIALRPHCGEAERFFPMPLETLRQVKAAARPALARQVQQGRISRVIHQTFHTDAPPREALANIEALRRLNPGWTYRYWSDKDAHDLIYQHYGWDVLKWYLRINPRYGAAKADLFRYLCIYALGGVYLDIKSGASVALDSIIDPADQFLLSQWGAKTGDGFPRWGVHPELQGVVGGEHQQWHVIGAAGHPFLEAVIGSVLDRLVGYLPRLDGVGFKSVLRVTGPIAYTLAIQPLLALHAHRLFDAEAAGLVYDALPHRPQALDGGYHIQDTPLVL